MFKKEVELHVFYPFLWKLLWHSDYNLAGWIDLCWIVDPPLVALRLMHDCGGHVSIATGAAASNDQGVSLGLNSNGALFSERAPVICWWMRLWICSANQLLRMSVLVRSVCFHCLAKFVGVASMQHGPS